MNKKFFDIFPPKPKTSPSPPQKEEPLPSFEETKAPPIKRKKTLKLLIGLLGLLIMVGIFFNFLLSRVEIVIWPETETLNFKEKVTVDSKIGQLDLAGKTIPGKIFEDQKSASQQFSASGKTLKKTKAKGIIRVYNNYSTSPQILVKGTRFISDTGKLFRSTERVTIPGGSYEKSKLVPGYLDIEVEAAEAGPDYNIGPSTFSIPGFAGTPKYTAFYGKSFSPMEGGFLGEVSQILEKDLEEAKKVLTDRVKKESQEAIKNMASEDFVLLDEGISQEIIDASSLYPAGAEVEKFDFQVKIKSTAIGFKKSELENFVKEFIKLNAPADKRVQPESIKISYSPESINIKEGKINLNLDFSGKVFAEIDEISLKKSLAGKSLKEIQILLEEFPKIIKAQVKVFPFWLKKVPQQPEKIKIKLKIDPVRNSE
jgi:hypothetical protein